MLTAGRRIARRYKPTRRASIDMLRLACALLSAVCCLGVPALAKPPSLGHALPLAVTPGEATDVTLHGGDLTGARALWTSFPAEIELAPDIENNGQDAGKVTYRITTPAEVPLGVHGLRLVTSEGVSNVRLILVDDLPTVADNGQNKTIETAQEITVPVAIDGTCEPESFDYYKLVAVAGDQITIEVFAQRLGTALDPVVRLLDEEGRELAYSDDEGGIGADCRFAHEFAADGTYYIEIRDIRYQGGGGHRYRMRIGRFPLVTAPFPMATPAGSTVKVDMLGPATDGVAAREVDVPREAADGVVGVNSYYDDGLGGAFTTLLVSDLTETLELEPNDTAEQASPLVLPGAVNGRFAAPQDRDFYQFDAKQGERWRFIGVTRTAGSPTDLYMRLHKADGSLLAEVDDTGTEEGILDFNCPEDGTYHLMVEDLHRRGGPEHGYRIEARAYEPGFRLSLEADTLNAPQGGVAVVKVNAARRDYNGPITLGLLNAPDGVALAGQTIEEGKNETELRITVPSSLEPGHWNITGVVGRAKIGERDVEVVAGTRDALRGQLSGLPYPPAVLDSAVALGIGGPFPDFFTLATEGDAVRFPQLVGTASFKVKAERSHGFDEAIALAVEGLPGGYAAEVKPVEKGQGEVEIKLAGPVAPIEAEQRFRIVGTATFQNQPKRVVLGDVALRVVPPLEVAVTPAGPLVAGGSQKVTLQVTRHGDEKPAVAIAWQGLPIGVEAPAEIVVPEGQDSLEVELTAAPDAAIGEFENVSVAAWTTISGRDVRVTSPAATLEVVMP